MGPALAQSTKSINRTIDFLAGRGLCRKFLDSAASSFRPAGTLRRLFSAVRCSTPDKGAAKTAPQGFSTYFNVLATASQGELVTRVMSTGDPGNALFYPIDPSALAAHQSHSSRRKVPSDLPCLLFGRGLGLGPINISWSAQHNQKMAHISPGSFERPGGGGDHTRAHQPLRP